MTKLILLLYLFSIIAPSLIGDGVYFGTQSIIMFCFILTLHKQSKKTIFNFLIQIVLIVFSFLDFIFLIYWYVFNNTVDSNGFYWAGGLLVLLILSFAFARRLKWSRIKCDGYNPNYVQQVFCKPETTFSLLGSILYFDGKGSIKYCLHGLVLCFKKNKKSPQLVDYRPSNGHKYKTISKTSQEFYNRAKEIETKKYNPLFFNCRHLL